jgi:hypothetical protein
MCAQFQSCVRATLTEVIVRPEPDLADDKASIAVGGDVMHGIATLQLGDLLLPEVF